MQATRTIITAAMVVLAAVVGAGLVTAHSHKDGNRQNGEELRSGTDEEDQVSDINYSITVNNHQPGASGVTVTHYAIGWTENFTLHWITGSSNSSNNPTGGHAFDYSSCEPASAQAFGIDRGNDDPGSQTDVSLLKSYKGYTSKTRAVNIQYYKEEQFAGGPINISIYDQFVGKLANCNVNPSEPGWYQVYGWMNGSTTDPKTETDFMIADRTNYVYICECSNRQEAVEKLGPSPGDEADEGSNSGSQSQPTPTETAASTATSTTTPTQAAERGGSSTPTGTATSTVESTPTGTATSTVESTPTGTATSTVESTPTGTVTATQNPTSSATSKAQQGSQATTSSTQDNQAKSGGAGDGQKQNNAPLTPTAGAGPGFGITTAGIGLLLVIISAFRRD